MEIAFKKSFRKLLDQDEQPVLAAKLLSVIRISDKSQLSEAFIEYDTDNDYFIEEDIPLLMLLFLKPSNNNSKNIFATVRNWTEEKEYFYQSQIGHDFNVVIENL